MEARRLRLAAVVVSMLALASSLYLLNFFYTVLSTAVLLLSLSLVGENSELPKVVRVQLTERQQKIYDLLLEGKSKREIARTLNISVRTLYKELKKMEEKGVINIEG